MTFYELIFLRQFLMKLLGLPTTKHFISFILGCPQDFNFARPFCPFSPVSTQPYQNGRAKLKSCGHLRIKLKKCFVVWRPKSFIENCRKKNRYIKRHLILIHNVQKKKLNLLKNWIRIGLKIWQMRPFYWPDRFLFLTNPIKFALRSSRYQSHISKLNILQAFTKIVSC